MERGCIFNIQRFTVHDGPGIRTEVFLKGCPLSCPWCSNPESHAPGPEPGIYPSRCLGRDACDLCEQAAAPGAVLFDAEGKMRSIRRDAESDWAAAVAACPSGALKVWGEHVSVDEIMEVVERDRGFYETSGGGVTVSGGEPLVQSEFALSILRACRQAGIHTCLESALHAPWEAVEPLVEEADLLICDLKCVDSEKHERFTGVGNGVILQNLTRIAAKTDQVILRIPVIPGFNDTQEDFDGFLQFLEDELDGRLRNVQLMEFMHLGGEKCRSLERPYPMAGYDVDREQLHGSVLALQAKLAARGFECSLGGRK